MWQNNKFIFSRIHYSTPFFAAYKLSYYSKTDSNFKPFQICLNIYPHFSFYFNFAKNTATAIEKLLKNRNSDWKNVENVNLSNAWLRNNKTSYRFHVTQINLLPLIQIQLLPYWIVSKYFTKLLVSPELQSRFWQSSSPDLRLLFVSSDVCWTTFGISFTTLRPGNFSTLFIWETSIINLLAIIDEIREKSALWYRT